MPKVSVIMPSLNVAKYIRECLESVVNQTLSDIEIICIDAGSNDGTLEIIQEYANRDNRIQIINSPVKSYGYQVNRGFDTASGEYVAILETDDYIESDMYEYLYDLAKANDTDIAKADFDRFCTLTNGEKMFTRVKLFGDRQDLYNRVINPRDYEPLFCTDYFLWKGIYKLDFINNNHIRLNETPGAAFQDMGFMHQVLSYAKRAIYSDKSFHRYRTDRDEASTYSPKILKYGYTEFNWLLDKLKAGEALFEKGIYIHMLRSFRGELYSVLQAVNGDYESEYVKPYYEWYIETIKDAIAKGIIDIEKDFHYPFAAKYKKSDLIEYPIDQIPEWLDISNSIEKERESILEVQRKCEGREVVIFGSGLRGSAYLKKLDGKCNIVGFVDNSADKQGQGLYGYKIVSLDESMNYYNDCIYIIANRFHYEEIVEQLNRVGVDSRNIIVNPLSDTEGVEQR